MYHVRERRHTYPFRGYLPLSGLWYQSPAEVEQPMNGLHGALATRSPAGAFPALRSGVAGSLGWVAPGLSVHGVRPWE